MNQFWNEIQPVDSFYVTMDGVLHEYDKKVISLLYQPLIGPICTNLYTTLLYIVEENRLWSDEWNHYSLMNLLDLNLSDIFQARVKLEGIGLLKTHIKDTGDARSFIYELQTPLTAEQFFTDGMLNIYLFQKLGQTQFLKVKRFFSDKKIDRTNFKEITRTFQDVFTSLGPDSLTNIEGQRSSQLESGFTFIDRKKAENIQIDSTQFDFDLLFSGLSEVMIPRKAFTKPVKEAIEKLAFLYSINAIEMKNIVLSSLSADQQIDIELLRKSARDWYQMENNDQLPQLVDRTQPVTHRDALQNEDTKEGQFIAYLETTSPRQLMIDIAGGAEPAISDLQSIEEIMFKQKLLPGVVNVLIHYVMLRTDMKLSKNYLAKIASHWARKKVTTVKEAMELAINEHRQYQEWANSQSGSKQNRKKPIRTEQLPDWFVQPERANLVNDEKTNRELEEKRRRLEAIQQKYKKDGGDKGGKN